MEEKMSATLESIQRAAMQEFLDKGFQGASLRQIVKNAGVTTGAFYGYFSSKEALFNALVEPHAAALMGKFMEAQKMCIRDSFKVKVLELLLFLSCLEPAMSQGEQRACTPFQVRLARDVIAYVDAHRDRRVTAAQLGRELGVSTEQLRASVQQVYGKPLYQCIRAYKMRVAARLLRETDRTVLDIAGEFGYGNSCLLYTSRCV